MIEIIRPGLLTTVQDGGRMGYQAYGVPVCGAMDWLSLALANILAILVLPVPLVPQNR